MTFIFLVVALILLGIPAVKALIAGTVDFTNSGLAFLTASMLF